VVSALSTPTKTAMHRAVKKRGCHLKALMALYAVESLLIADSVVNERFVKPSAAFDGGVSSNKMVLLIFQQLNEFGGNQRLQIGITNVP
jgi:hypothetical protein